MTDRERCYPVLRDLKNRGRIASYIASQHPMTRRWGFKVTLLDETLYYFLPREVLAFAEGIKLGYGQGRDDEAAAEPTEGHSDVWKRVRENDRREFDESGKAIVTDPNEPQ